MGSITISGGTLNAKGGSGALSKAPTAIANVIARASRDMSGSAPETYDSTKNREYKWFSAAPPPVAVAFKSLDANGSNTVSTTALTLTFDKDIAGLAASDITVTGATKGALTKESGTGVYTLTVSNITVADGGTVNVAVAKAGFTFTPTNRDVTVRNHAPVDPPTSDNTITGIAAGQSYTRGDTMTFTAIGGGMNNTAPNAGDMRWLPTAWATNPSGNFSGGYTQSFSTTGMTLGSHTLTVTFAKQRYNGTAWVNTAPVITDTKSVNFTLVTGFAPVVEPTIDPPYTASDRTITVVVGNKATMSVTATGATSYQWYRSKDGGRNFSSIGGATSSSYTTSSVTMANDGYRYYCIATNSAGSTRSCVFVLNVIEQPDIPATGDNSQPVLWLGIMLMAGAGLATGMVLRRRRRSR